MKKVMLVGAFFCATLFVMGFTSKGLKSENSSSVISQLPTMECDCSGDAEVQKYYKLVLDKVDVQCNSHKMARAVRVCQKKCQTTEAAKEEVQRMIDFEDSMIASLCQ